MYELHPRKCRNPSGYAQPKRTLLLFYYLIIYVYFFYPTTQLFANKVDSVQLKKVVCFLPGHFKIAHVTAVIVIQCQCENVIFLLRVMIPSESRMAHA